MNHFSSQLKEEVSRAVEEKGYIEDDFNRMLVDDNFPIAQTTHLVLHTLAVAPNQFLLSLSTGGS
ncbi:hypothetical protein [Spirosoma horti]